jgi:glycosyltransferase involved in cell wall biosynthesis
MNNIEKPLVSVLMTSYNRSNYIASAIESVMASTYAHWELIIVDDGSRDDTVAIARRYAEQDQRIRVYENEKNLGDYPNRNHAASLARGKYIKYVDADDAIYPWGLDILVTCMEQFPEAGWGLCSLDQFSAKPYPFMLQPEAIFEHHNFKASLFHKAPLSAIIRKDLFDAVGGFSGKRQMSDVEMWHILSLTSPLVLMPHGIVWYRAHEEQESAQIRAEIIVRARYLVAVWHFYRDYPGIPMSTAIRSQLESRYRKQLYRSIRNNFLKGRWKDALTVYRAMKDNQYDFKQL